ncbi:MAG: SDR family oxidoreductase [Candidatus Lokiarchaeota archaeon]|nr:SDR family oxidoreductase [Candidatus Lokiarchaeota archaeon]
MTYSNKVILITGASTGIGRACTEFLALKEFRIYAGARKKADLNELSNIKNVKGLDINVTNEESVQKALKFVKEEGYGLHAIVNNAGIAKVGPLMDLSTETFSDQFNVNLFGVHRVTKAFFPLILESKGRIIMMSSNSGFISTPFFGPYCSSKFALEGYADALRREVMLYDIKVVIVQPGRIKTPIWTKGEETLPTYHGSMFEKEAMGVGSYAIEKGKSDSLNPIEVAKVVYKAITKKKPKTRYMIVPDKFRNKLMKILPDKTIDRVVRKELEKFKIKER